MLHRCHLKRSGVGIDVVLLNSVVTAKGEQRRGRTIVGDAGDAVDGWNDIVSNLLCTNIPCSSFATGAELARSNLRCSQLEG